MPSCLGKMPGVVKLRQFVNDAELLVLLLPLLEGTFRLLQKTPKGTLVLQNKHKKAFAEIVPFLIRFAENTFPD
jgi:hypothetical protein